MNWTMDEYEALYDEVYREEGHTMHLRTEGGLNRLITELELFAFEWDYNAMCERSDVRTAQRLAQGGMIDEE